MTKYRRMTYENRIEMRRLYDLGYTISEIAQTLSFHRSTIYRERSKGFLNSFTYCASKAQRFADLNKARPTRKKIQGDLKSSVEELLKQKWSPQQISERLRLEKRAFVSHETIYQYIFEDAQKMGSLHRDLRWAGKKRKCRLFPKKSRLRVQIPHKVSMEERSVSGDLRLTKGHWERDLMLGKNHQGALLVLVDRKTRYTVFRYLQGKTAKESHEMTIQALQGLPVQSVTNDCGKEFSWHEKTSRALKKPVYFCSPYTPSERGSNEERIGRVRQYLPKKTDLRKVSKTVLKKIQDEINFKPMKVLDWKTPYEVFHNKSVALVT